VASSLIVVARTVDAADARSTAALSATFSVALAGRFRESCR
jgi:hypothetical protein